MTIDFDRDAVDSGVFTNENWAAVLAAVDASYAELVERQTELEQQNANLLEFRRMLQSILGSVHDMLVIVDRDGRITDASASLHALTGLDADALKSQNFSDLFAEDGAARVEAAMKDLRLNATQARFEAPFTTQGNAVLPFDLAMSPRIGARGRMVGAIALGRPLGELQHAYRELEESHAQLKDAQAQLVRNEKLAGLGRLLAGVAHELNNPISFVYANAHALERYVKRFEIYFERVEAGDAREELVALRDELELDRALRNLRHAIDGARDGSERVRDIVNDLRRLSADGSGRLERFDLVEVTRVAVRWVIRGSKASVVPDFSGLPRLEVLGNPGHVQQIVMNLVQNALDAMHGQTEPGLFIDISASEAAAHLTMHDTGPGVCESEAAAIFDPFFTTKPVGQGTGLGLAISHKIADEHGGRLSLIPTANGACFRLTLPLEEAP